MQLVEEADLSTLHRKTRWIAGGYVSTYFYKAFMAVWNGGLKESFKSLHANYPSYSVWTSPRPPAVATWTKFSSPPDASSLRERLQTKEAMSFLRQ
ncbi:hypothetical protein Y032_0875g2814 [Ancylostoma ceylanicum]|uniref:Fungal lipase-type domain-containing protein n=1 Tax=Ancylostoma ceylanicum TaxID=53326 RepID=A0A016W9W4_9BILA|nr:hypothetical protein Y032_0875g2814 [Ancylostoma ceylanicum]